MTQMGTHTMDVMAGLDPAIHAMLYRVSALPQDMDARIKSGQDETENSSAPSADNPIP